MRQKLLLNVKLPDTRFIYDDMCVLPMLNVVLKLYKDPLRRLTKEIKEKFKPVITKAYKDKPFAHKEGNQYHISLGYYRGRNSGGRKTATIDAEGLSFIKKIATDVLIKCSPIPDDCIFHVPDSRCVYAGEREEEELWLMVTVDDYSKYKVLSEYIPDWFRCRDLKTGGTCIVHRSQL